MSALLKELWDSGILGGIFTTAVTFFGQLSAIGNQRFASVLDTLKATQTSDVNVHDSAFTRSGDGGIFIRRVMLFMGFFMLGVCPVIFAFFTDVPVAVEIAKVGGGYLWGLIPERECFEVAYVNGFYLSDIWKDLMANLISAYIGAGITRKAFTLSR